MVGRHQVPSPLWMRSAAAGARSASGKSGSAAAAAVSLYGVRHALAASLSGVSLVNSATGDAGSAQPPLFAFLSECSVWSACLPPQPPQPPLHARRSASEQSDFAASQIGR